jgi:hypothetical protein
LEVHRLKMLTLYWLATNRFLVGIMEDVNGVEPAPAGYMACRRVAHMRGASYVIESSQVL